MLITSITRSALQYRRFKRDMERAGYEEIGEHGGPLWELYRGPRIHHRITDVKVAPNGKSLFVKIEPLTVKVPSHHEATDIAAIRASLRSPQMRIVMGKWLTDQYEKAIRHYDDTGSWDLPEPIPR